MARTSRRDARARVVGVLAEAGAVSRAALARRAARGGAGGVRAGRGPVPPADRARRAPPAPRRLPGVVSARRAGGLVGDPAEPVHRPGRAAGGRPPVLIALHRSAGVVAGIDF